MDSAERVRRTSEAAASAARRTAEAKRRLVEIERRLAALRTGDLGGSVERTAQARRAAAHAMAHCAESRRRARRAHAAAAAAYYDAARAHEAAALAHQRLALGGVGDTGAHRQRSEVHRQLAAADRVAGLAQTEQFHQDFD